MATLRKGIKGGGNAHGMTNPRSLRPGGERTPWERRHDGIWKKEVVWNPERMTGYA